MARFKVPFYYFYFLAEGFQTNQRVKGWVPGDIRSGGVFMVVLYLS